LMHPHTSSFSYRIAAAAARLGVLLTPRGLDDVPTASAVCFLALGFWLPIRHALIERHYFPSPPHFFSAVASSFSHTLATVPHRAGLPYFQTLARLPDVRAFSSRSRDISHFTVTLNHPPVARYLALHRRRSEWSSKAQIPISIAAYHLGTQPSLALRSEWSSKAQIPISIAAYHLGTQPSLALQTHLCSDDSEHYTIQASLAVTLRRCTHPPHARMRLIGGKTECLTRTAFSSVVAACRCCHESFFKLPGPHCDQRHRGAGLLRGGLAQRLLVRRQLARADRRRCHLHHALGTEPRQQPSTMLGWSGTEPNA
jgi:hypothetical protein